MSDCELYPYRYTRLLEKRWIAVHGPIPLGKQLNHTCDQFTCLNIQHVYLGTQSENVREAYDRGLRGKGQAHCNAKFSDEQVEEMKRLFQQGMRQKDILELFPISQGHLSFILNGKKRVSRST